VDDEIDVSHAIALYLKRYPAVNDTEFDSFYGPSIALVARGRVRKILDEAMRVEPDWNGFDLNGAGDHVESVMRERHPDLNDEALMAIGNYYTYLMR
jgi:hypothetical protein